MFLNKKFMFTFIILSSILLFHSCGDDEVVEELVRHVRYKQVSFAGGGSSRTFSGTAKVGVESNLSFKVSGNVESVKVKVGQSVRKGQLLVSLDDTDYKLQKREAEAALREAESQALNAKNNYDRVKQLYENNSSSKSDLDNARSASESAKAAVERLKNGLQLANLKLGYTKLIAPLSGSISACNTEVNENVQAGQTVAVLIVGDDMEVQLGLSENVINRVSNGMGVSISFASVKNKTFDGIVSEVSPTIDKNSSTYPVSIKILEPSNKIKSGMAANVKFQFGGTTSKEVLVVPVSAVGEDSDGRFVFIVEAVDEKFGKVKKTHIEIGELTSEGFEVLSGLSINQKVATAGLQSLLDDQKVRL